MNVLRNRVKTQRSQLMSSFQEHANVPSKLLIGYQRDTAWSNISGSHKSCYPMQNPLLGSLWLGNLLNLGIRKVLQRDMPALYFSYIAIVGGLNWSPHTILSRKLHMPLNHQTETEKFISRETKKHHLFAGIQIIKMSQSGVLNPYQLIHSV